MSSAVRVRFFKVKISILGVHLLDKTTIQSSRKGAPLILLRKSLVIQDVARSDGGRQLTGIHDVASLRAGFFHEGHIFSPWLYFFSLNFLNGIDGRNELPRKNRSTLKKSFPKSIKNSSHNRFEKLGISHPPKKVMFFKILNFLYRKSCSKFEGFG